MSIWALGQEYLTIWETCGCGTANRAAELQDYPFPSIAHLTFRALSTQPFSRKVGRRTFAHRLKNMGEAFIQSQPLFNILPHDPLLLKMIRVNFNYSDYTPGQVGVDNKNKHLLYV